ncbi:unnamed protein product, partial [marine sediment metagenome]
MGDSIITNSFVDLGAIAGKSVTAPYVAANVEEYTHLKRRFRAGSFLKNDIDFLLKFEFAAKTSVMAVVLNDVNFTRARIRAHGSDLGVDWSGSTFNSGADHIVSIDERVNRYKIFIPTVFDLKWMVVQVPVSAGTSIIAGDYITKSEVGSVIALTKVPTISKNAVVRTSIKEYEEIALPHGGFERISRGSELRAEIDVSIDQRSEDDETQYWNINKLDSSEPLIYYENDGDTSKVYLCVRDTDYAGTRLLDGLVSGNTIKLK